MKGAWSSHSLIVAGAFAISLASLFYSHHFFWFPIAPHHELGDSTSWHRERSVFSPPTSTSESRKNLIVVPCDHSISLPSAPDIATLLLQQSSINILPFTFSHGHIATEWGETMQYKVWQTICFYRDQRKDTQRRLWRKTIKFQYVTSLNRLKELTWGVTREKGRFVELVSDRSYSKELVLSILLKVIYFELYP